MKNQVHLTTAWVLGLAVLSIPTLATAEPEITAVNLVQGFLIAKGAAVELTVDVTCTDSGAGPDDVFIDGASLTQRVGKGVASGSAEVSRLPIT